MSVPPLFCDWAEFVANVATFLGVFIAIGIYLRERKRERQERELTTYCTLNSAYVDHLRLCLDNPYLSSAEFDGVAQGQPHAERDQDLLIDMAVCMLESAYFLYRDHDTDFRRAQWDGWNDYMRLWCQHPELRRRWPGAVERYDRDFVQHITKLYQENSEKIERSNVSLNTDPPKSGAPVS